MLVEESVAGPVGLMPCEVFEPTVGKAGGENYDPDQIYADKQQKTRGH